LKHNLKKIDGKKVLAKLAAMPVYQWQPKGQNSHILHMGPMAQDFMKAFGMGEDDKLIGMQDADGVALAAIQGLNQIVKAKDAEIDLLKRANVRILQDMAAIKKRLGM
jgi:trimeric autotransporter adhesin